MFNRTNLLIILLAFASAGTGLGLSFLLRPHPVAPAAEAGSAQSRVVAIGQRPDAISLPDREGSRRRLDEWTGKLLVVNFWASWCGPCRDEMPLFENLHQQMAEQKLAVIGIASESAEDALGFLAQNPVSYPILINAPDDPRDVSRHLGNTHSVLPYTVLIDRNGVLAATHIGSFSEQSLRDWIAPFL